MIRSVILAATIASLVTMWMDKPAPVAQSAAYCLIEYQVAGKDLFGAWRTGWATGYGLCADQDKYFQI